MRDGIYDEATMKEVIAKTTQLYYPLFIEFEKTMSELALHE